VDERKILSNIRCISFRESRSSEPSSSCNQRPLTCILHRTWPALHVPTNTAYPLPPYALTLHPTPKKEASHLPRGVIRNAKPTTQILPLNKLSSTNGKSDRIGAARVGLRPLSDCTHLVCTHTHARISKVDERVSGNYRGKKTHVGIHPRHGIEGSARRSKCLDARRISWEGWLMRGCFVA
jgi:hypothetical protein